MPFPCTRRTALLALLLSPALSHAQGSSRPLRVVASFSILSDLVRQVGGERVAVQSLVGPDSDAHVYRATPQDAKRMLEADLIVVHGLGFDGFVPRLIRSSGAKAPVITVTKGFVPIEMPKSQHNDGHDHGRHDPHAWQSIEATKIFVSNLRDGLIAADPAGEAFYRARSERYLAELAGLKAEIEALLAAIPRDNRLAIAHHDSFRYFSREFGIRIEGVRGLSTEAEPSARDIARIIRIAKERKAKAVFLENIADPRIAAQLARETGARLGGVLYADALTGEDGAAPTYAAMMRHNARTLKEALQD